MTRAKKRAFIRNLCKSVANHLITKVDAMPEEWDGHELREAVADAFDRERTIGSRNRYTRDTRRLRAYRKVPL